ncbi:MAG: RlmI/RlmK family 23S rRNA methyltransferase, partial [Pseudomonadota bacterium]
MTHAALPRVRLKPKTDAKRLRFGHPWVFSNEMVLDRRTKALEPGQIARLEDGEGAALGVIAFNPRSKISGRILSQDPETRIDADWIAAKIDAALALRMRAYPTPFYRLVHAEGDGLPGVVIDRFADTVVFQANAAWADTLKEAFAHVLETRGMKNVILNGTGRARALEGLL